MGRSLEVAAISAFPTLKSRSEFLAVRGGSKASCASFLIEGRKRRTADATGRLAKTKAIDPSLTRFGFTITKKLGNAVVRNRIRRRLKAAVTSVMQEQTIAGFDYVIVARTAAFDRPYSDLIADLRRSLDKLHGRQSAAQPGPLTKS
ncbi:MAG: ribonuclease P protein component [Hyphomicrobium sp.]|nr:ribonuclease P protein component [Hyphomicrobium sp.]